MNNIDVYEYVCRYMAYYGHIIVISPDYRLAPEHKFPTGLEDAYGALTWTSENIHRFYGNKNDISLGGDSSGGNFAAAVSMMARDRKGPAVKAQVLFYPLTTNMEEEQTYSEKKYGKGYFLEYNCMDDPLEFYFNNPGDKTNPLASPLLAENLSLLPPTCFISAECDPLLDQGLMYAARLEDRGVEVEYHILKGMIHGFINWAYGKTFDALQYAADFVSRR